MQSTFWYVYRINGAAPCYKHTSYASALIEAERLASTNGWGEYQILKVVSVVKPAPKTVTEYFSDASQPAEQNSDYIDPIQIPF